MKAASTAATALGVIVVGVLVLEAAIHWTDWLPGGRSTAESTQKPGSAARSPRSGGAPTGQMPPRHDGLIHGTKADDVIEGIDSNEQIETLVGGDRIVARGGDDVLDGGGDADVLMGGKGNDTYVIQHHGGGADIIVEEEGTDTLQLSGGRIAPASIEILRHGDDLLIRWAHDRPADITMIRSWFADAKYHVERLQLTDGTLVLLEPLAARAKQATSEDVVHFRTSPRND